MSAPPTSSRPDARLACVVLVGLRAPGPLRGRPPAAVTACWSLVMSQSKSASILDAASSSPPVGGAFRKLDPRSLARNPVMFVVAVGVGR